jgi:AraC-like DNA-binding protein
MRSSNRFPLVRAAVLGPFIQVAERIGTPVEKLLHSVRLPSERIEEAGLLLPETLCWRFINSVSTKEGIRNFGLIAANTVTFPELAALVSLTHGCSNLFDVLKRFCLVAPLFTNNALFALEGAKNHVWFSQKDKPLLDDCAQVQLFQVLGMSQLVQLATGPQWRPDEIHFSFGRKTEVEYASELNPSRIVFGKPYPSIAVPRHLLSLPLRVATTGRSPKTGFEPIPEGFSEGLRRALTPYLGQEKPSKNLVAEALGVSPRTLHRRLADEHTSYSEILDQTRLMKAATLLKETDMKLLDITLILGYENASSFTRAFHRWAGLSPREYRQLHYNA